MRVIHVLQAYRPLERRSEVAEVRENARRFEQSCSRNLIVQYLYGEHRARKVEVYSLGGRDERSPGVSPERRIPLFIMQKSPLSPAKIVRLSRQFEQCKAQLLQLSWITQGSIFQTQQGTWCWTRKVKAKTVTVALSAQQAELFEQAVAQHRKLERLLAKMRAISQTFLLQSIPGPVRRKRAKPS